MHVLMFMLYGEAEVAHHLNQALTQGNVLVQCLCAKIRSSLFCTCHWEAQRAVTWLPMLETNYGIPAAKQQSRVSFLAHAVYVQAVTISLHD